MQIYLTRHSQTVWNTERRLQGRQDSPLTTQGKDNAKALANYLHKQNLTFDFIYSSPIPRAYQTSQILFDTNDIIQDDRLREMNFGIFEGQRIEDILSCDNGYLYDNLWNHPEKFDRIPDGESYNEIYSRVQSFLDDLKKLDANSTVFITTHGMCFIIILACMLHYPVAKLVQLNQQVVEGCSLTLVEYTDDFHLVYKNKHEFLPHVSKNNAYHK